MLMICEVDCGVYRYYYLLLRCLLLFYWEWIVLFFCVDKVIMSTNERLQWWRPAISLVNVWCHRWGSHLCMIVNTLVVLIGLCLHHSLSECFSACRQPSGHSIAEYLLALQASESVKLLPILQWWVVVFLFSFAICLCVSYFASFCSFVCTFQCFGIVNWTSE